MVVEHCFSPRVWTVLTRSSDAAAAAKKAAKKQQAAIATPPPTPGAGKRKSAATPATSAPTASGSKPAVSRVKDDLAAMGLADDDDEADPEPDATLPPPVAREDILRELERRQAEEKPTLSLVVVGPPALVA